MQKELFHPYDNASEVLAHGISLSRTDLLSEKELDQIVRESRQVMHIDIDEHYSLNVKSLYAAIVEFNSHAQWSRTRKHHPRRHLVKFPSTDIGLVLTVGIDRPHRRSRGLIHTISERNMPKRKAAPKPTKSFEESLWDTATKLRGSVESVGIQARGAVADLPQVRLGQVRGAPSRADRLRGRRTTPTWSSSTPCRMSSTCQRARAGATSSTHAKQGDIALKKRRNPSARWESIWKRSPSTTSSRSLAHKYDFDLPRGQADQARQGGEGGGRRQGQIHRLEPTRRHQGGAQSGPHHPTSRRTGIRLWIGTKCIRRSSNRRRTLRSIRGPESRNGIPVLLIGCKKANKDEASVLGEKIGRYHRETPSASRPSRQAVRWSSTHGRTGSFAATLHDMIK